jgi:hypothetical protein
VAPELSSLIISFLAFQDRFLGTFIAAPTQKSRLSQFSVGEVFRCNHNKCLRRGNCHVLSISTL